MTSGNELDGLLPGSHTHSVAHLSFGDTHTISRSFDMSGDGEVISAGIADQRRKLAHSATAVFARVREKLPERRYSVNTGLMVAGDNRLYICAVIERVK